VISGKGGGGFGEGGSNSIEFVMRKASRANGGQEGGGEGGREGGKKEGGENEYAYKLKTSTFKANPGMRITGQERKEMRVFLDLHGCKQM
jgi:hypothetical protein